MRRGYGARAGAGLREAGRRVDAPRRGCGGGRWWTGRTHERCSRGTERGAGKTARRIITRSYDCACETSGRKRPVRLTAGSAEEPAKMPSEAVGVARNLRTNLVYFLRCDHPRKQ